MCHKCCCFLADCDGTGLSHLIHSCHCSVASLDTSDWLLSQSTLFCSLLHRNVCCSWTACRYEGLSTHSIAHIKGGFAEFKDECCLPYGFWRLAPEWCCPTISLRFKSQTQGKIQQALLSTGTTFNRHHFQQPVSQIIAFGWKKNLNVTEP